MPKIPLYKQDNLASSLVGTPGVDKSAQALGNDILQNTAGIQSAEAAAQEQNYNTQGQIQKQSFSALGQEYKSQQEESRRKAKELKVYQDHQQAIIDDRMASSGSLSASEALVKLHGNLQQANMSAPNLVPDLFKKQAPDVLKNLVDSNPGWSDAAKDAVTKHGNTTIAGIYSSSSNWAIEQATRNALAQTQVDSTNIQNMPDNQDPKELQTKFAIVKMMQQSVRHTLGPAAATKWAADTNEGSAKNFLQGMLDNSPLAVRPAVELGTIPPEILDQKAQDAFVRQADIKIAAQAREESAVQKHVRLVAETKTEQTFATAKASDNMALVESTRESYVKQINALSATAPDNENTMAFLKDLVTKVSSLDEKIRGHEAGLAADARAAKAAAATVTAEEKKAAAEQKRATKEQVAAEHQAQRDYFATPAAAEVKGNWLTAAQDLPKTLEVQGTAAEQTKIETAKTKLTEAYNNGALGPKYLEGTKAYYNSHLAQMEALLNIIEEKRKSPNPINTVFQMWQGRAHEKEAIHAPAPPVVKNATGISDDDWVRHHIAQADAYKKANGLAADSVLDARDLAAIRNFATTKALK